MTDATETQAINPEIIESMNLPIDAHYVVFEDDEQLEPQVQDDDSCDVKNMSDTIDFIPETKSYWM